MATEADKIFEALSNKFTGEVNAKEFIEKVFFGENPEYLNDFHDKFRKELFNPVKNRLGVVFKMIQRRLDSIKPEVVDSITEPFKDLEKFSNDVKNKTEDWLKKLDEKYKKILESEETEIKKPVDLTANAQIPSVNVLPTPIQNTEIVPESKKTKIKEQQSFGPEIQTITFSEKTEGFFKDLFNKTIAKKSDSPKSRDSKDKDSFSYGGMLADGITFLLAGLAGVVGAFMTNGPIKGTLEAIGKGGLKAGLPLIAKSIFKNISKTALKRIPLIGTIFSYAFAWQRFDSGDTIGGILDLVSGTINLLDLVAPGLGSVLATGVDVLQAVLDAKAGGSSAEASGKKKEILGDWASGIWKMLKKSPIGQFFNGIERFYNFWAAVSSGDLNNIESTLEDLSTIGYGIGDTPKMLLSLFRMSAGRDEKGNVKTLSISNFISNFKKSVGKTILSWIPNWFGLKKMAADMLGLTIDGESINPEPEIVTSENQNKLKQDQIKSENKKDSTKLKDVKSMDEIYSAEYQKKIDDLIEKRKKEFEDLDKKGKLSNEEAIVRANEIKSLRNYSLQNQVEDNKRNRKSPSQISKEDQELLNSKPVESPDLSQVLKKKEDLIKNKSENSNQNKKEDNEFKWEQDILPDELEPTVYDEASDVSNPMGVIDDKGVKHIIDKQDKAHFVATKDGDPLIKGLNDIKNVMKDVHNSISKINSLGNTSIAPVNISNTSNNNNNSDVLFSTSRDPIFATRNEWWKISSIGRVTV